MRAAIFAGLAGIVLVLLLLAYFYRRLITRGRRRHRGVGAC